MPKFDYRNIEIDTSCGNGQPVIAGTQIRVATVLSCYRQGLDVREIVRQHPSLTPADVHDALAYAYDHMDSEMAADEEIRALDRLATMSPSNTELRRLATNCPPPSAWLDGDEERPW